jgi:hypothetical protein
VSLLLLASRLWQAFLLLLASFKFLMVSCCWSEVSAIAETPGASNGVVGTGGKFADGVVETGDAPRLANISANFRKKFETALMV